MGGSGIRAVRLKKFSKVKPGRGAMIQYSSKLFKKTLENVKCQFVFKRAY